MREQLTIYLPDAWRTGLERIARNKSVELDDTLSAAELIRIAISQVYGFEYKGKSTKGRKPKYK